MNNITDIQVKMKLILSIIFTLFVSSAVGEVIKHVQCENVGKENLRIKRKIDVKGTFNL